MNILESSEIGLIDFDDLIKAALPAHGYYTNLHPAKTKGKTMPVQKTRKDGVIQTYWMAANPKDESKRVVSVHYDDAHDSEKHLQHLKDEYGFDPEDVLHLGVGDKVKITGGKEKDLKGKLALVYGHKWSEKHPAATVVVKIFDDKKDPTKYATKEINVNNLSLEAKATTESKDMAMVAKPKAPGQKEKAAQTKTLAEKFDITYGFYTRPSDGQRFFVESMIGDTVRAKVMFPKKGDADHFEIGYDVMKHMLYEGIFIRDVPPAVASKENQPYSYLVESGKLQEQGLVYYGEGGEPEAKPEAHEIFTKAIMENWDEVRGAVISTVAKYKDINSYDVEDILSNVFVSSVNRLKEYEPYLYNGPDKGLKHFLINKAQEAAIAQAYGVVSEKKMAKPLDTTMSVPEEAPSVMDSPHSFIDVETIESLDNLLKKELSALSEVLHNKYSPDVLDIMAGWMGIGKFESEYSIDEAAKKLDGKLFDGDRKLNQDEILTTLKAIKAKAFVRMKEASEKFPAFANMLAASIKLRDLIKKKKHYEPYSYEVSKVAAKVADTSNMKAKVAIGRELLKRGVSSEDIPKLVGIVQDILNYKYTPIQITKEEIVPKQHIDAISGTIDHFGGLKLTHIHDKNTSFEEVSLKDLIHNAEVVHAKNIQSGIDEFEDFNAWKAERGLPLSEPGEKWKAPAQKYWKSLATIGKCEIFELGA